MADGGPEAIDAQLDDPGIELVPMDDKGVPFFGPLQAFEGLADAEPVQRFAGEADWVEAGGDIPEKYLEWIEGAEARGERVPGGCSSTSSTGAETQSAFPYEPA